MTTTQNKNEQILQEKVTAFNQIKGPRVGDYLKLPYGLYTRFTHKWEDSIQTGGSEHGSYYLNSDSCSYSGGLDSGVKLAEIKQTEETKEGTIWFFDQGISGAGRGVYFQIQFRVFEPIEGANLSGCPQIKVFEKAEFLKTVDTVTRVNGNGQPYTTPLPECIILQAEINQVVIDHIKACTGMEFTKATWNGYKAQPIKHEQLNALLLTYNFKTTYYNNSCHHNTLMLEFYSK